VTSFRKVLALALTVLMAGAALVPMPTATAAALPVIMIASATPDTAGARAAYHITFSTAKYSRISELAIRLPYDTRYAGEAVQSSSVTVNGVPVRAARFGPLQGSSDIELYLYLNQVLGAETLVQVECSIDAGIINPAYTRSCYRMRVGLMNNGFELGELTSDLYVIVPSSLDSVTVDVEPAVVATLASYKVEFVTGVNGQLKAGQDNIVLAFPSGVALPSSLRADLVTLNGISCRGKVYLDDAVANSLRIYLPFDIAASSLVTTYFPVQFGIRNPLQAGPIRMGASTSTEPTLVQSLDVVIAGREVTGLAVALDPNTAGAATGLEFAFATSPVGRLAVGQRIYIQSPSGFGLPALSAPVVVTVNGQPALAVRDGDLVSVQSPQAIADSTAVSLVCPAAVGWRNPTAAGLYEFAVYTEADASPARCRATVVPPGVAGLRIEAASRGIGRVTALTVAFSLSAGGALGTQDQVRVTFASEFVVPTTIFMAEVRLNGSPAGAISVIGQTVVVAPGVPLPGGTAVTVEFTAAAGIGSPRTAGSFSVVVSTSKDTLEVRSNALDFQPLINVTIDVTPDQPNGSNGSWIGTAPQVLLVADNATAIYYRLDGGTAQQWAGVALAITSGRHAVEAWAVDAHGTEGDRASREFVVDLIRPAVTLDAGAGDILAASGTVTLTGTLSEAVDVLQVNGVAARIDTSLRFAVQVSVIDGQSLVIFARDLAGNTTSSVRKVRVDSVAPAIVLVSPAAAAVVTPEERLTVSFRLSEPGSATVNGISAVEEKGVWSAAVPLSEGANSISVVARDSAGNQTSLTLTVERRPQTVIMLTVGSSEAMIGTQAFDMGTQPVLMKSGTVMVPLRFISEALGATVDWLPTLKIVSLQRSGTSIQLQVGSKTALVDLQSMTLLEAPLIANSRTLVPLRFISEAFGADVRWDQLSRQVTIIVSGTSTPR
jgi:hypothetical protein